MGKIKLNKIRTYSYHGCMKEERIIGSEYETELSIWADLSESEKSDNLNDTIDYICLNRIVKEEMNIPSNLLENVAHRILNRIFVELKNITKAKVRVSKLCPPINGDVEKVSITLVR